MLFEILNGMAIIYTLRENINTIILSVKFDLDHKMDTLSTL
jgi:hypothetical protein